MRDTARPSEGIVPEPVRVDKWLWAARFFKTRSQATEAIAGGKVEVNGQSVKPARPLQPGDRVRVRQGPFVHEVIVRALATRRGSTSVAATLYEETEESRAARERLAAQLRMSGAPMRDEGGRPTKKDRRDLDRMRWKRGG